MKPFLIITPILVAAASATSLAASNGKPPESDAMVERADLAADRLARGEQARAITLLERKLEGRPQDPALLINLGIAQAQQGQDEAARATFHRARSAPVAFDLETAEGSLVDSRRLARRALVMLDRGEFRTTP